VSAPTPDALAAAERRVSDAHDLLTHATLALWATQPRDRLIAFADDVCALFSAAHSTRDGETFEHDCVAFARERERHARAGVDIARAELNAALDARRFANDPPRSPR